MKNAIVTGATGFVGRWLVRELLREDIHVTAVVRPQSPNRSLLPQDPRLEVVECPLEDYSALAEGLNAGEDCVFYHLAWAGVSGGQRGDLAAQLANVNASVEAVKCAKALGCTTFVGLGTIMEAEAEAAASADEARPGPGYLYGGAKRYAHLATKAAAAQLGIAHLWPMLTNAYGEYEYSPRFINATLRKMRAHEPLEFTAGTQNYDFIHIEDAARALVAVGRKGRPFHSYLIGSGEPMPLRSYVETMGKTLAPNQPLHFGSVPYTGVHLPPEAFSTQPLREDTGFVPQVSFEEGLRRAMAWLEKEEGNDER